MKSGKLSTQDGQIRINVHRRYQVPHGYRFKNRLLLVNTIELYNELSYFED